MNYIEILNQIFNVCIVPLLGVLTAYIVAFIKKKVEELDNKTDNDLAKKYINMLSETVTNCVIATNQTYVNVLKDQNIFDEAAQKKAFELTYDAILTILTEDAKDYLSNIYGDLSLYITKLIESEVNQKKHGTKIIADCKEE